MALAAARLPILLEKQPPTPPQQHPAWAHIAFLEEDPGPLRSGLQKVLSLLRVRS